MIPAVIIMFIASLGNILTLGVLKNAVAAFLWYHCFICLALPAIDNFILKKQGLKAYAKLIGLVRVAEIKYLVVSAITGVCATGAILIWFAVIREQVTREIAFDYPLPLVIAGAIYIVFFNGILEEVFWRGYIHTRCLSVKSRPAAILLNSLFFASYHSFILVFIPLTFLPFIIIFLIFLAGIVFEIFREKSLSIIPSVIFHVLLSVGYTVVFLFLYFS